MDNSSFFSTPIAGLILKISCAFNLIAIAIVFLDASIYESSLRLTSYWPWLIISALIIVFLLWKHYKAFNKRLDMMVSNALSGSNIKPILLYLRPFVSDGYLIEACHGFNWFYKKAMKKIFMNGELTCSNWLGSLKITNKLAWQFLPLSVLYAIISLAFIIINLPETERGVFLAFVLILIFLLLHMRAFYRYCGKFFLIKSQTTGLFISTIVALVIGWITASYFILSWEIYLVDILDLNLIAKHDVGSTDLYPTYTLFGLFILWSVISAFVYVTAFLFFCGQRKLVFKAASQADNSPG